MRPFFPFSPNVFYMEGATQKTRTAHLRVNLNFKRRKSKKQSTSKKKENKSQRAEGTSLLQPTQGIQGKSDFANLSATQPQCSPPPLPPVPLFGDQYKIATRLPVSAGQPCLPCLVSVIKETCRPKSPPASCTRKRRKQKALCLQLS